MPKKTKSKEVLDKAMAKVDQSAEIETLKSQINTITELLEGLVEKTPVETPKRDIEKEMAGEETKPSGSDSQVPFPPKWRDRIDKLLGPDFYAELEDTAHGDCILKVFIPDHLDRRTGETQGRDLSTGLIRRKSALSDIDLWCQRIGDNLRKYYPDFRPTPHE